MPKSGGIAGVGLPNTSGVGLEVLILSGGGGDGGGGIPTGKPGAVGGDIDSVALCGGGGMASMVEAGAGLGSGFAFSCDALLCKGGSSGRGGSGGSGGQVACELFMACGGVSTVGSGGGAAISKLSGSGV